MSYCDSDQVTESSKFPQLHLHPQNSIEPATKLRKTLNHCSQCTLQGKISETVDHEKIFSAWEEWEMDETSMPSWAEHASTHSRFFPLRSSLSQYILSFIEVSLGGQYVLSRQPVVTDLSLSALPLSQGSRKSQPLIVLFSILANPPSILAPFPTILEPMKDKNFKHFRILERWARTTFT